MTRGRERADDLPAGIVAAVLLLSLAVLLLQIVLNRIFSFTIWYHFAYISVSLALLGFGAGGAVLAAFPGVAGSSVRRSVAVWALLAAVSCLLMLVVIGTVRLDPFDVLRQKAELGKLLLFFAVVSVPFFCAGLAIAIALRAAGRRVNALYSWDLVGAGLGCALVIPLIASLESPRVEIVGAALCAAAAVVAAGRGGTTIRRAGVATVVLAAVLAGPLPRALPFAPSSDKQMADWARSGSSILHSRWGPIFRIDVMSAYGGTSAPLDYRDVGISPRYDGPAPAHLRIYHDATAGAFIYQVSPDRRGLEMFRHHVLTTPYVVRDRPEVLVIGIGGGADVVNALENGAARVTGAELDPLTVDVITRRYRDFTGGIYDRPEVAIRASEGRHFVRSTRERFDLLQITGVDTLAALSTGAYILSENYLYTVEAYLDYFGVLRPDGILGIGTLDGHPRYGFPRHALRFAALSYDALLARGITNPSEHIMIVGTGVGISELELLTKLQPFTDAEIAAMERFIDGHGFEAWYLPHRPARQLPVFREFLEGTPAERDRFFDETFLSLRAPTDDRPFFFSYYKWRHLFERRNDVDTGHTLATGQLMLALIFVLATLFSVVAILLPVVVARRGVGRMPGRWRFLAYFAALGAGFMFLEISFVQRFILFLGYPTYSLTVTLFSFLTAAGIGAHLSGRLPEAASRVLPRLAGALTALLLTYLLVLPLVFRAFLAAPLAARVAVTFALCLPLGAVLGMFFPYGIRLIAGFDPDFVAWAWAVNGCLSVVGSVATIIVAMSWGFDTVILLALGIYWIGAVSFVRAHEAVARAS
jgi:hypothetical protein